MTPSFKSQLVAVSAAAVLFALPNGAWANGRFPEAQRLLEHPGDPERLYLAGTWGLLLTEDRGESWFHVCELSFAHTTFEGDPLLELTQQGTLLGGIFDTLNRSDDCGCEWPAVLGQSEMQTVLDVTKDASGRLIALLSDISGPSARSSLSLSDDDGRSWRHLSLLPEEIVRGITLDVAPSDPTRLYVSALSSNASEALLLASSDTGTTWERHPITGTTTSTPPYIAAVHPSDPDGVYLRTDAWEVSGGFAALDRLYVTEDGGESFEQLLEREAKLLGFALSPDGETVLAGYGDPIVAGLATNPDAFGIYKASRADYRFERIYEGPVSCLRWTDTGLYACTIQNHFDVPNAGPALGFAPDAAFTLDTTDPFVSLLELPEVRGPLGCTRMSCQETWGSGVDGAPPACQQLGAVCDADTSSDGLSCAEPPGEGAAGEAGSSGSSGAGRSGAGGGAGTSTASDEGGCGCQSPGTSPRAWWVAVLSLFGLRRRTFRSRSKTGAGIVGT